jgi:hypothetical protein
MTYSWLSRTLAKHNTLCIGMLPRKISSFLHPVKDNLGLTLAVCSISCECGQVYIRHTDQSIQTRIKQHHQHIQLGYPHKLAVAECRFNHSMSLNSKTLGSPLLYLAIWNNLSERGSGIGALPYPYGTGRMA